MLETHGGLNTSARHSGDQLYRLSVGIVAQQLNSTRRQSEILEESMASTRCGTPMEPFVAPSQGPKLAGRNEEAKEHAGKAKKQKGRALQTKNSQIAVASGLLAVATATWVAISVPRNAP